MLIFFSVRRKNCPLNLKKKVFFYRKDVEKLTEFCRRRNHLVTFDILEIEFVASKNQAFIEQEISAIQKLLASDRMSTVIRIKMNLGNQKEFAINFGKGNFRDLCALELYYMTAINYEYLIPFITQDLTLVGLNLNSIPKHLSPQLSYLDLSENDFSKLTRLDFTRLRNLYYLVLSKCKLNQTPVLPCSGNMVSLDLSHNCYTYMPPDFIPDSVEDLFLENNQLLKYPLMPLDLMNVKLGENKCTRLPENLTRCSSLQSIDHEHISVFFSYAEKMFIDNIQGNIVDSFAPLLSPANQTNTNIPLTPTMSTTQQPSASVSPGQLYVGQHDPNQMELDQELNPSDITVPSAPRIPQQEQEDDSPVYWNFQINHF